MQPTQFVIALDIVEDFLVGEGIQYLRLVSETRIWHSCSTYPMPGRKHEAIGKTEGHG
jgi:hypothetical protein